MIILLYIPTLPTDKPEGSSLVFADSDSYESMHVHHTVEEEDNVVEENAYTEGNFKGMAATQ